MFGLDDPRERRCKGVALSCSALWTLGANATVETRVSVGKNRRYLAWITSAGGVLLFEVPPLEIASSSRLRQVSVKPLARIDVPCASSNYVSPMHSLIPRDEGPFILSLTAEQTCFTLILDPATSETSTPSICISSRRIPTHLNYRTTNTIINPTGTLGVYLEHSVTAPSIARLWALTASHSKNEKEKDGYVCKEVRFGLVGWIESVVFDEIGGLVCSMEVQTSQPNEPSLRQFRVGYHPLVNELDI